MNERGKPCVAEPLPKHSSSNHGAHTLVCKQLHEQGVRLAAVDDVCGTHALRQAPCAALHPAADTDLPRKRRNKNFTHVTKVRCWHRSSAALQQRVC